MIRKIKSKRADENIGFDATIIIPIIIFITFVFISYVFFSNAFFKNRTATAEAETKIYAERLIFSNECLAYFTPATDRVYPGIIDSNKFTTERISMCMNFSAPGRAALKAELIENGVSLEAFYNKEKFPLWYGLSELRGSGSYEKHQILMPVSVFENGEFHNAIINITVVVPK